MTNEMNRPSETDADTFTAGDYLLGLVQNAISAGKDVRIALPGKGDIALFPARKQYATNTPDMKAFCEAPAAQYSISPLETTPVQGTQGKIVDLLWQAAFYASKGKLIEGCSKYDVVQFRRWPNLTRLPHTPNTMRAFALLTRFPTTMMLVPRRLGSNKEEISQIYSAAYCSGLVNLVSRNPQTATAVEPEEESVEQPTQERSILRSLFSKISGL